MLDKSTTEADWQYFFLLIVGAHQDTRVAINFYRKHALRNGLISEGKQSFRVISRVGVLCPQWLIFRVFMISCLIKQELGDLHILTDRRRETILSLCFIILLLSMFFTELSNVFVGI